MREKSILLGLLFPVFVFSQKASVAQKTFTIKYVFQPTTEFRDSFYFYVLNPSTNVAALRSLQNTYPLKEFHFFKRDSGFLESSCTFSATDTACVRIFDGFGYESFVIPGDTIIAYISKKPKIDGHFYVNKDKGFLSVWFHDFRFSGKNQFIYSLFDSLAWNTGMLQYENVTLQKAGLNLDSFFQMTTGLYHQRVDWLNRYCSKYHLPSTVHRLALAEIRSAYVTNLLQPLSNLVAFFAPRDYPKDYRASLITRIQNALSIFPESVDLKG